MDGSRSRISVREFIASVYLSKVNVQFDGEFEIDSSQSQQPRLSGYGLSSNDSKNLLRFLQATKLALLLAKAFEKLEYSNKGGNNIEPKFLQLDNFFINYQVEVASEHEGYEKYSVEKVSNSDPNFSLSNLKHSEGKKGECGILVEKLARDDVGDNSAINHSLSDIKQSEEKKVQDDISDYPDFLCSISDLSDNSFSEFLDDPPKEDLNDDATIGQFQQTANTNDLCCETSEPKTPQNTEEATWTIHDIDFQAELRGGLNQSLCSDACPDRVKSLLQILGSHIYAIFSRNNQQNLPFINLTTTSKTGEGSYHRSQKQRISNGSSLFSILLETGDYPISVCRLLSDMIGMGCGEDTDNPFKSLDEVIQDLEQMSNHPQLFLHDQSNDFYSSTLHFGWRCYGREKELTKFLEISSRLEQSSGSPPSSCNGCETVFVSGVAGSGKSHFVQNVGRFLTGSGWTFLGAKFEREMEHESREVLSSLFQKLVANIVEMKSSREEADIDYHRRATEAILGELKPDNLSRLSEFIPNVKELFSHLEENAPLPAESDMSLWQLVFLLSKLMRALSSLGRNIFVCLDDLQWCGPTMLILIKEIIMSVKGGHNFLFAGMYRDDEISESHPLANQLAALHNCSDVHVTRINLRSLSADGVADMISSEIRLPKRLVRRLADVVHKKTSGHAIFVVHVLDSLVRDSTITYSPQKRRFDWDENKIAALRMGDSVAKLLVSNLSSLRAEALQRLRILSCFGAKIPLSLIKLVEGSLGLPGGGIESFLPRLAEEGFVEMSGSLVFFSHDLIQQHVYENTPLQERRSLHLDIGTCIASEISFDSFLSEKSVEAGVEELKLDESNAVRVSPPAPPSSLAAIATNQINFAGTESVLDRPDQLRFARWNLSAGKDAADRSNFQAALFYYKYGIAFLGDRLWIEDCHQLCYELHEGLASAFFAIGDHTLALQKANAVIDNVPFEESLVAQYIRIRSLDNFGRYLEAVTNGLNLLRLLKIDIPCEPSPAAVMSAMEETGRAASAHSFSQMTSARRIIDAKKRDVMKCANALVISFFRSASPYLPLVACALVNYSLQNGICHESESATAFVIFGYFNVSMGKYEEGRYWGNVVLKILEEARTERTLQTDIMCTYYLNVYYYPFKELSLRQLKLYHRCMALGELEGGLYALRYSLELSFYGGVKLSIIMNSMEELIETSMKHSKEGAKLILLSKILIGGLVNDSAVAFHDFGGVIYDEHSLLVDAQVKKNFQLIEKIHVKRFNSAFWMGDYTEASKWSRAILALPSSKMPKIHLIFHTFYMGLIAFQLFRDGGGEDLLDEGKQVLKKMRIWSSCSTANFFNKLLLLEAEHHASMSNIHAAKAAFEASVRSARNHGLVQEQGLACELYGKFLSSIIEIDEALCWLKCAHACYMQWGAVAKADKVWKDHNLDVSPDAQIGQLAKKHGRE